MAETTGPVNADMTWDPNADIQIKGHEWQEISNFLQLFQGAMIAYNAVTARNVSNGTIQVRYVYQDGREVPPEELQRLQAERLSALQQAIKEDRSEQTPLQADK